MYKILLFLLITMTVACQEKVGGPCEYQELEEVVGISEIVEEDGKITFIYLSAGDASNVRSYRLSADDLRPFMDELDFRTIKDERRSLLLQGEEIRKGTCVPFVFTNLQLLE